MAHSCPLDFSDLYVTGAYNDSITLLFPSGDTLTYKDHLVLDAQGKATITALASDRVTRQDYAITALRHEPTSTATPYEFDIVDSAGNWREAYNFSAAYSHGDIDSVAGTVTFQLPYDADIDETRLHVRTRFSSSFDHNYGYGYLGVRTAGGDTVDAKHPLKFDAKGQASL